MSKDHVGSSLPFHFLVWEFLTTVLRLAPSNILHPTVRFLFPNSISKHGNSDENTPGSLLSIKVQMLHTEGACARHASTGQPEHVMSLDRPLFVHTKFYCDVCFFTFNGILLHFKQKCVGILRPSSNVTFADSLMAHKIDGSLPILKSHALVFTFFPAVLKASSVNPFL